MSEPRRRQQRTAGRAVEDNSSISRRELVQSAALALTATGLGLPARGVGREHALAVHAAIAAQPPTSDAYAPRAFHPNEWELLGRLAELILPADERSPSARDVGAPEFIDLLSAANDELARIFTSGMLWLDHEMRRRYGAAFVECTESQQTEMLDLLAADTEEEEPAYQSYEESVDYQAFADYELERPSGLGPGVRFFGWVRRLTVDAFYTSPEGIRDVDYQGNRFLSSFDVPEEAIRYALARSPFAEK